MSNHNRKNTSQTGRSERDPIPAISQAADYINAFAAQTRDDFMEMLRCAIRLKRSHPDQHEPHTIQGYAHLHLREPQQALSAFRVAHAYAFQSAEVWRGLALALDMLGYKNEAATAMVACVMLRPMTEANWIFLRELYVKAGLIHYLSGVDRAIALARLGEYFKWPRQSLYRSDFVVWQALGFPSTQSRDWGDLFEDPAEGSAPALIIVRETLPMDAKGDLQGSRPNKVVKVCERYRDHVTWHPIDPMPPEFTAEQTRESLARTDALMMAFGAIDPEDPQGGARLLADLARRLYGRQAQALRNRLTKARCKK